MMASNALEGLQKENEGLMESLGREGIQLDIISMLKMRLDYVTDFLLGDDEERHQAFALGWEESLNETLKHAQSQVARAKLTVPMPGQLTLVGD